MKHADEAISFKCGNEALFGVLSIPETPSRTAVVVVVGGPQYRAGSHRQFVLLARHLAMAGYAVLRFDYRGMGDSEGGPRDFMSVNDDVACAMDALQKRLPIVQHVVLWGLCDGASAALLYCQETSDSRVSGLCLLNPWVRSDASLARTQVKHYYLQRMLQPSFWRKLFSGKVAASAVAGLAKNIQKARRLSSSGSGAAAGGGAYQTRMAGGWTAFSGPILLLLSGDDYTAKEFLEYAQNDVAWSSALKHPRLLRHDLPDADHTCSSTGARTLVEQLTQEWLDHMTNVEPSTSHRSTSARVA